MGVFIPIADTTDSINLTIKCSILICLNSSDALHDRGTLYRSCHSGSGSKFCKTASTYALALISSFFEERVRLLCTLLPHR